jgi:hypothetical protein
MVVRAARPAIRYRESDMWRWKIFYPHGRESAPVALAIPCRPKKNKAGARTGPLQPTRGRRLKKKPRRGAL